MQARNAKVINKTEQDDSDKRKVMAQKKKQSIASGIFIERAKAHLLIVFQPKEIFRFEFRFCQHYTHYSCLHFTMSRNSTSELIRKQ